MRTSTASHGDSARSIMWTAVLTWGTLALSVPLLATAAWFAYEAATATSTFGSLVILVTVAIAVPAIPAVVLAVIALRIGNRHRARSLAIIAALLVVSVPLWGLWLGLA